MLIFVSDTHHQGRFAIQRRDHDRFAEEDARNRASADFDVALPGASGDLLEALDVNPVICGPGGCLAVDALVVPG